MKRKLRFIALLLAVLLLFTGCAAQDTINKIQQGKNFGADWINSEIEGAINESTPVNVKDDYFTAVNKSWILEQEIDDSGAVIELFNAQEAVDSRKLAILEGTAPVCENPEEVGLEPDELEHAAEILSVFAKEAGDIEGRNAKGVEPLRPYIDAITSITTIEEMNAYILDEGNMNIIGQPLIHFYTKPTRDEPETNVLQAGPISQEMLSLRNTGSYRSMDSDGITNKEVNSEIAGLVLGLLGWSSEEISLLLRRGYDFEYKLAKTYSSGDEYYSRKGYDENHDMMTQDELQSLAGEYPVKAILEYLNCGNSDVLVEQKGYISDLGRLYTADNLDEIKAYYVMHTVYTCADLLDIPTKETVYSIVSRTAVKEAEDEPVNPTGTMESSEDGLTPEQQALKTVLDDYVSSYLPAPLEMMYIASYCSGREKAEILDMVTQIKEGMQSVISNADWLSDESKLRAAEKLDMMKMLVLYPDEFISYKGLDLSSCQSLVDMVHNIMAFENIRSFEGAGGENDRSAWDLRLLPTTDVNAYNMINKNEIIILAGIVSNGFTFSPDYPDEVNFGRLGVVLGHEMTHGFDSIGSGYNKYGFRIFSDDEPLLNSSDFSAFTGKVFSLSLWYASLMPLPDGTPYSAPISGEAIADMGGMKAVLYTVEDNPDFDYDLFFRSYAQMWRKVNTLAVEEAYAAGDSHPLAYLRTNVTLQQFDKFFETYGIGPEDGMYISQEDRISVW